jgi:hypothetical protein
VSPKRQSPALAAAVAAAVTAVGLALCGTAAWSAPGAGVKEYELKAVLLYNFASFVTWPADAASADQSPMVVGVLGDDPFGKTLEEVFSTRTVNGRPFEIRRYRLGERVTGPQILFISTPSKGKLARILATCRGRGILTVGEAEDFAAEGGVIGLVVSGEEITLEINQREAEQAGLVLSSKLLRLARLVDAPPPSPGPAGSAPSGAHGPARTAQSP